jgi:toxin CcdB
MQFDIYVNTDKDTNKTYPYFMDVQSDLLDTLNSRVVIPLTPVENSSKDYPKTLCPRVKVRNKNFALLAHQITSVPLSLLKGKAASAKSTRNEIIAAIDFVVTGI